MYLLDTNVVSDLRRFRPERQTLIDWHRTNADVAMAISAITILELEWGYLKAAAQGADHAHWIREWIDRVVEERFSQAILPVDIAVARSAAYLKRQRTFPSADLLIGATAVANDLVLVTRNTADFEGMGIPLLNPWDPTPT
jgi:predicted nucleic acid-binding protein